MCLYYSLGKKASEVAAHYGKLLTISGIDEIDPMYKITAFTDPQCWVVTNEPNLKLMYWGLIPFWVQAKDDSKQAQKEAVMEAEKIRKGTYNARAETLWEKRSFWKPVKQQRCIIPSTGYFEFNHPDKNSTIPYYFFPTEGDFFSMAGIWDSWEDPETGDILYTFSQITTEANSFSRKIHNGGKNPFRQPLILKKEDEEKWLDPELKKEGIRQLLKPLSEKFMDAYPVNNDFLKKNRHDVSILQER